MRRLSVTFYENPRLTVLAIGLLVVAGLSSFAVLPRMEDPLLTPRAALVLTHLAGADAEQVEALVTDPIEDELREIPEIKELRSESRAGMSTITVELRDDVYGVTAPQVWSRVRDRLADAEARLPVHASRPRFEELEVTAYTRLIAIVWDGPLDSQDDAPEGSPSLSTVLPAENSGEANSETGSYERVRQVRHLGLLRRVAEDLRDQLLAVPGTKDVDMLGDPREEIAVEIAPSTLASLGLTASRLSQIITNSDARVSAGQLRSDAQNLQIEVSGELDGIAEISQIPVAVGDQGQVVRLSDIAGIRRAILDPPDNLAIVEGRPAVVLACLIRPSQRVDVWSAASERVVRQFADHLSGDVRLVEIFNQNIYVQDRLETLLWNLMVGVISVIAVVWWLMGWRSAIIVGSALPLSSFMVLAGMRWMNIPIHQMSVTGLIIALGLLIDNAIVLVDEVHHRRRDGMNMTTAIEQTIRNLAVPLFGSTLTTALAFAPIALMPGPAGEFVSSISINVIMAIFSSLLLSLTIVPALTGFLDRRSYAVQPGQGAHVRPETPLQRHWYSDGWRSAWLTSAYERFLKFVLQRPWLGVLGGMVFPVLGFIQAGLLPEQFFPPADRNQVSIEIELPAQSSLNATLAIAQRVRTELLQRPEVEQVAWFLGRSAPPFYYNQLPSTRGMPRYGQALVQLKTSEGVASIVQSLQRDLDRTFSGVRVLVRQLEQGPPFIAPIEVRVKGPDLDKLATIAASVRSILVQVPQVTHVRTEASELTAALTLQIDEDEARVAGLDHHAISEQISATLEGAVGGLILEGTEELPLRVRVADEGRDSVSDLQSLTVLSPSVLSTSALASPGRPGGRFLGIPVRSLGEPQLRSEVTSVTRLNRRRINEVQGFIQAGVLPAVVLGEFQRRLSAADLQLPAGYEIEFGGEAAERNDAVGNLMASVGILAVTMVATLVLSFGSFRMASIIGMVAFLSIGLGLGSLWLWGWPFGFMAIIGTMGLIGVAINDSIVVLAGINADVDAASGDHDAIRAVVMRCTRHVIATSLTTIAGFLPLWIGGGRFWPPLAVTIAGGVGGATLLAIFFVPSMFLCLNKFRRIALSAADPDTQLAAAPSL
ncbi:MAG: efflux RND transporter permease subunit [Planctomycetaceae bacterium]